MVCPSSELVSCMTFSSPTQSSAHTTVKKMLWVHLCLRHWHLIDYVILISISGSNLREIHRWGKTVNICNLNFCTIAYKLATYFKNCLASSEILLISLIKMIRKKKALLYKNTQVTESLIAWFFLHLHKSRLHQHLFRPSSERWRV